MEKPHKLGEYDGNGDPSENVQLVNDQLNYFSIEEAFKCKLFSLTVAGPVRLWFNGLAYESIESWIDFCEWFSYTLPPKRDNW